jgi:hypothetical protein
MSAIAKNQVFTAVHTVGGLLPADMLVRIAEGKDVSAAKPADYKVVGSRSVNDDAERHWEFLKAVWKDLRKQLPPRADGSPAGDPIGLARSQWIEPLFAELGFGSLTAVTGGSITADDDPEKVFRISHRWRHVPVHVPGWSADLDRRPGGTGTVPPQSLVQEALNRTSAHLWAVVTNGRQLRLLRDSSALATAAYVEFDLEAVFDGELFSEFVLLYRLLHVSRFEVAEDAPPSACVLEKWRTDAVTSGTRALEQLRQGVQQAITVLGTGFLKHPANGRLREDLDIRELHGALLRMVYRLLFLFVAEDREALHPPNAPEQAKQRYADYFSSARLRRHARRRRGTAHGDQYQALRIVLDALGDVNGRPELALPGLGGLYSTTEADAPLRGLELSNEALLSAVRHLAQVRDPSSKRWRAVDYRNLDAEELGSVYESLLELVPRHSAAERTFELVELAGNERKTTGSYYTPSSLIETLLDSSLDPVVDDAVKRGEQQATKAGEIDSAEVIISELLKLTVCDPACGSGHFLVAAARRIAKRVAAVREGNPEPTVDAVRHAMHEVVARCVYGVDLNPMAVELTKVSLWLEALEPGKPLNFLDAHIKHGNALFGATPALLRGGIPDDAFKPIEGDDKKYAKVLEKINMKERGGQTSLFDLDEGVVKVANTVFGSGLRRITMATADSLRDVRRQESAYQAWQTSEKYAQAVHVADAWCAAFVWRKVPDAPRAVTHDVLRALENPESTGVSIETNAEIVSLRDQYRFFHWHLEFPDVFTVPEEGTIALNEQTGWSGGFSLVCGNPPWDEIGFKEKEFFGPLESNIAEAKGARRKQLISEWAEKFPGAGAELSIARRRPQALMSFAKRSESYPLCTRALGEVKGVNSLKTEHLFTELLRRLTSPVGRVGCIVPTDIATGVATQFLFQDIARSLTLCALYDFENQKKKFFSGVHASYKFCILTLAGVGIRASVTKFAFFLHDVEELHGQDKTLDLSPEEIDLFNPNTGTLPVFRSRRDADITAKIYRRVPVLMRDGDFQGNPWGLSFLRMIDTDRDSTHIHEREGLEAQGWKLNGNIFVRDQENMLPLYEAKMVHQFDHRWAGYKSDGNIRDIATVEKQGPGELVLPRYWVPGAQVGAKLAAKGFMSGWLLGWRNFCRATDIRTSIVSFLPLSATPYPLRLMLSQKPLGSLASLAACQNSMVFDYASRQKIGSTDMTFSIWKQLPVLRPESISPFEGWISRRVLELTYTAYGMASFARDLGDEGAPFRWDEERRAVMRAELDALFFHLYGINRDDVDYIMETFPIVRRKDEAEYGTYRTKERVLEIYDRMAEAGVSLEKPLIDGENFTSTLTPSPGHGPRHAPA